MQHFHSNAMEGKVRSEQTLPDGQLSEDYTAPLPGLSSLLTSKCLSETSIFTTCSKLTSQYNVFQLRMQL